MEGFNKKESAAKTALSFLAWYVLCFNHTDPKELQDRPCPVLRVQNLFLKILLFWIFHLYTKHPLLSIVILLTFNKKYGIVLKRTFCENVVKMQRKGDQNEQKVNLGFKD